nr:SEC-C metal-binding domain-containing protein [Pelomicrobium methylotrophicum]
MNAASNPPPLPAYAPEELARLSQDELLHLLVADEDRAPRALIDECARRGEAMVDRLAALAHQEAFWNDQIALGQWWLRLHAVMILGLIPSESAGRLLVSFMRRMERAQDENLQDWLSGYWPALFRNKPEAVEAPLRELALDRGVDWYMRIQAVESIIAFAQRRSADALEATLDWAAGIAADESEDWTLRLVAGNKLLDFPRERHRALLEDLAARQTGWGVHFSQDDVRQAFTAMNEKPHRDRFDDPWAFYAPAAIERRQARWAEEDRGDEESDEDDFAVEEPYVRPSPKIGRNDPCPCGSGKKYKKCCLLKEES